MTALTLRVFVIGLAGYRLARLVAVDSLTEGARSYLFWAGHDDPDDGEPVVTSRPLAWLYRLVSCPFCVGVWIVAGLYLLWAHVSDARPFIAAIAAMGVAAILAVYDRSATDA